MEADPEEKVAKPPALDTLPREFLDKIVPHLPLSSLKSLRLASRIFDCSIIPHLFRAVRVSILREDFDAFLAVPTTPHLARVVRKLIWYQYTIGDRFIDIYNLHGLAMFRSELYRGLKRMPHTHEFSFEFRRAPTLHPLLAPPFLRGDPDAVSFNVGLRDFIPLEMTRPKSKICCVETPPGVPWEIWPGPPEHILRAAFRNLKSPQVRYPLQALREKTFPDSPFRNAWSKA